MSIKIVRVMPEDELSTIAESIVGSEWGRDNEQTDYREDALEEIVSDPSYLMLFAYVDGKPAGLALAVRLLKPGGEHWLYVDEIDTHPDYRRQGVAKALMEELFEYAKRWGLKEVWLGTEPDNKPANALYQSLKPSEREEFIGYTFEP
jgi:ribosomal protein S18 acetylase RimI-like enzyme